MNFQPPIRGGSVIFVPKGRGGSCAFHPTFSHFSTLIYCLTSPLCFIRLNLKKLQALHFIAIFENVFLIAKIPLE